MAYDVKQLQRGIRPSKLTNGTGSGTLYVEELLIEGGYLLDADGAQIVKVYANAAPSTTDTYGIGSEWNDYTNAKMYYKTAATTWTVVGSVT